MLRNGRRLITPAYAMGYRAAISHARRSLRLVEEDLRLENQMIREEIETLRAETAELRSLAGMRDPDAPLN
jgi:hypothetical protein